MALMLVSIKMHAASECKLYICYCDFIKPDTILTVVVNYFRQSPPTRAELVKRLYPCYGKMDKLNIVIMSPNEAKKRLLEDNTLKGIKYLKDACP